MDTYIAKSFHFSIKITKFEEPEECYASKIRRNSFLIIMNEFNFEVIGSYET